ncbi:L-seryl-tRNA(Sec) kinase-like isoform X2 [Centroberyx gerrardi]
MDADDAASLRRPPACLCVLCGLPAAGKSTLARTVSKLAAQQGWRSTVVPYDDLIPDHAFQLKVVEDDGRLQQTQTEWRLHRQAVLQCIEQFLRKPQVLAEPPTSCHINAAAWGRCVRALLEPKSLDRSPLLILLDDNFYYPSMRYDVYQLARKCSLGFCQVYLHCAVESCISRNQSRSQPLPTEVILEMAKRLESPNPQKNSWEESSVALNSTDNLPKGDIQRLMELISSALSNPLSPVDDNVEQKACQCCFPQTCSNMLVEYKYAALEVVHLSVLLSCALQEADRLKCAASVVHQADQACRRLVSEAMKNARGQS